MMKPVAELLRDNGELDSAYHCAEQICRLMPEDRDWELARIRMLFLLKRYTETLDQLDKFGTPDPVIPLPSGELTTNTTWLDIKILRAYCHIALRQVKEAEIIVRGLPEEEKANNPRVAIIRAEIGYFSDNPEEVVKHIVTAVRLTQNLARVRKLFPYLRKHMKWGAIIASDSTLKAYNDPDECFAAAEANMNNGNVEVSGGIASQAMAKWPTDTRLIDLLFFLTLRRPDTEWEKNFTRHFLQCINSMDEPDRVFGLIGKAFELARPDLGWAAYARIAQLDPRHPCLFLIPAYYGEEWFAVRSYSINLGAQGDRDKSDIRPMFLIGLCMDSWMQACASVPHGAELSGSDTRTFRKRMLDTALAQFKERDARESLSLAMHREYVNALEMTGTPRMALAHLSRMLSLYPDQADNITVIRSEILERTGAWPSVYETLKDYPFSEKPALAPLLRLCRAALNMRLSIAALFSSEHAVKLFPQSAYAAGMLAETLLANNMAEEALAVLNISRIRDNRSLDPIKAKALFITGRLNDVAPFCRARLMAPPAIDSNAAQNNVLPPAEASLKWHLAQLPSAEDFQEQANRFRNASTPVTGPYLGEMAKLWLDAYNSNCSTPSTETERWAKIGRNDIETAASLNQLTLLLCNSRKHEQAAVVADEAVRRLPGSAILWHILISLSNGDSNVIARARAACPSDSEIWLAELVSQVEGMKPGADGQLEEWTIRFIAGSVATNSLTPAALARAADYLLRKGYIEPACLAARNAVERTGGLLPVHLIGMRCAIAAKDRLWLLDCTRKAIAASLNPSPLLYRKLVEIRTSEGFIENDPEMLEALRRLMLAEPANVLWTQMMGHLRFKRGGWETVEAAHKTLAAIEAGATNLPTYLISAESFRYAGNNAKAVELLKQAIKLYPGNVSALNNLVYTLASVTDPEQHRLGDDAPSRPSPLLPAEEARQEALALIPTLLKSGRDDPHVLDTAAFAYIACNRPDDAAKILEELLPKVETDPALWFRTILHQAQVLFLRNKHAEALNLLKEILTKTKGIPDYDVMRASKLLTDIEASLRKNSPEQSRQQGLASTVATNPPSQRQPSPP
jgi:tetratricopeptide (TPR) repeat protein